MLYIKYDFGSKEIKLVKERGEYNDAVRLICYDSNSDSKRQYCKYYGFCLPLILVDLIQQITSSQYVERYKIFEIIELLEAYSKEGWEKRLR